MLKAGDVLPLGLGAFSIFAVLAGLALLMGADHVSPGCTGPRVERCDYVATAKAAVVDAGHPGFQPDLGFEIFDQGSSVLVQQATPPGEFTPNDWLSVQIDKASCRPCALDWRRPTAGDPRDRPPGPLIARTPPEDPVAAAARVQRGKDVSGDEAPGRGG